MSTLTIDTLNLKKSKLPESFIKGDFEKTNQIIQKSKLDKVINQDHRVAIEYHTIDKIQPLVTQRTADVAWAKRMLKQKNGFDIDAFGVINVFRNTQGELVCWNGLGRLLIADLANYQRPVPCLVHQDITEKTAAQLFAYVQDKGKRTLSKEVIYINNHYAGDPEALELESVLKQCGLYIKGDTNITVPTPTHNQSAEITFRGIEQAYKHIAKQDVSVLQEAKDMIFSAFAKTDEGCPIIVNDMFWAVTQVLVTYPQVRNKAYNRQLQRYLNHLADARLQGQVVSDWKGEVKGLSGNVAVSKILAHNLVSQWRQSKFANHSVKNGIRLQALRKEADEQ